MKGLLCLELRANLINKSFGGKRILNNVSFTAGSGHTLGLLGRNGAGKTTVIRILMDIFRADSGNVTLNGAAVDYNKIRFGYLPEERGLYPKVKVGAQMVYLGQLRGMPAKAAKKSAMDLLNELEAGEYWNKKLETLSKGNQQKVQLAVAVLHNPDVIILDEPFSGLDPVNAQIFKNLIKHRAERGNVVLFSSHQMPYVEEFCEHICILRKGGVVLDGKIRDIKKTYPRNKIEIIPETSADDFLEKVSSREEWMKIIEGIAIKNNGTLEITMRNAGDGKALLQIITESGAGFDGFKVAEPTLEEIFVEKTGDVI